jgi:hypothetical protein
MNVDYTVFSDSDLEQLAKDEQRKQIRLEAQAKACKQTVIELQTELAERAIGRKSIKHGDMVTVHYRDRRRDFRYEGVDCFHWSGRPHVRLRAFTTKGKPFKQADSYGPSLIPYITRKDQRHG